MLMPDVQSRGTVLSIDYLTWIEILLGEAGGKEEGWGEGVADLVSRERMLLSSAGVMLQ